MWPQSTPREHIYKIKLDLDENTNTASSALLEKRSLLYIRDELNFILLMKNL